MWPRERSPAGMPPAGRFASAERGARAADCGARVGARSSQVTSFCLQSSACSYTLASSREVSIHERSDSPNQGSE
eukprot:3480611-Prymnesium_polylepis.3